MRTYEYILACLPEIERHPVTGTLSGAELLREEIRSRCEGKDLETVDFLLEGLSRGGDEEFYRRALSHRERFIREFFAFDLVLRNRKARYTNLALGRPAEQDQILLMDPDAEQEALVDEALGREGALEKEQALDDLLWGRTEDLGALEVLSLALVLGFLVRLSIAERWSVLDPATGREFLARLVSGMRDSYKNKND